ncbi:amino acid permease [Corynebacterium coyleae]|uniref:amino acid permease n=1 Tax=Corynebacterium coyleae TaxID=53374 RepID=UPI00254A78A2|nr:amino acid permease [Corynebacterium coyleae]MDK8664516.1 amino acid permease [Corynebacterium coyleae]MDK8707589.1 amino acid permease [Corynebacterium coyleae]MDK8734437.1 amino acid permease [Corynebacterium coyleae]MDK8893666.1 amino acid permease [Corynebacterium coyleae]
MRQIKAERAADAPDGSTLSWAITLFGTAVGAGILFLPIDAGSFGILPLIFISLLALPMVFMSHRTYSRIVSASPVKGLDVLQVVTALSGRTRGLMTGLMYWLSIYPIVLIYGVSITNTMDSFLVNQLGGPQLPRWVLAALCVGVLTGAYAMGKKATLAFANILVYPLIIALAAVSIYLIPQWDLASFRSYQSDTPTWQALLLILPVFVFSFSHMPAISQAALDAQKRFDGDEKATEKLVSKIEAISAIMLVGFTMFFVWSCSLALGADGMDAAREANIPVLSYLANETHAPFLAVLSPIVALCAIASSYFGHVMGAEEGTTYLVRAVAPEFANRVSPKAMRWGIYVFVFVTTVAAAVINPSILDLISVVGGVFITFLVYIVPMLLFRNAKAFRRFANKPETIFVFVLGVIIMGVAIWQMFM